MSLEAVTRCKEDQRRSWEDTLMCEVTIGGRTSQSTFTPHEILSGGIGEEMPAMYPVADRVSPRFPNCCVRWETEQDRRSHSKEYESTLYGTYNCVFCYVNKTPKTGLGQNPSLSEGRGGHELQIDTQYARVGTVPASRQRSPPADHEKRWKNTRSAMVSMEFPGSTSSDGNNIKWQPSP